MVPRHFLGRIVLVVALLATLSHVCVLPLDTHTVAADTDDHDGNAFHAASCEALQSPSAPTPGRTATVVATVPVRPEHLCSVDLRRAVDSVPTLRGSPPLYLRYSALLI